jgi:hypothetical protein
MVEKGKSWTGLIDAPFPPWWQAGFGYAAVQHRIHPDRKSATGKFHKIKLTIKNRALTVRTRDGYYPR